MCGVKSGWGGVGWGGLHVSKEREWWHYGVFSLAWSEYQFKKMVHLLNDVESGEKTKKLNQEVIRCKLLKVKTIFTCEDE